MIQPFTIDTGLGRIAGIQAMPDGSPRARLLALHGGGYDHHYWHDAQNPAASILLLGTALGFEVIAPDRPGYAGSRGGWPDGISITKQADLMGESALVDTNLPVFVIGHSMGGSLAIAMASGRHAGQYAGIDVAGVALRFPDSIAGRRAGIEALVASGATHMPPFDLAGRRMLFFSDEAHFDSAVPARTPDNPMPVVELADASAGPATLPEQMRRIRLPVRWTAAAHETTSETGEALLDEVRALLAGSSHVETCLQQASGHNVSQHRIARAYHLRAIAFFEEVMARRL